MSEILRQHTRRRTSRDGRHYSASNKYSNSIRGDTKGLIRADELPSQVPFFLLLLIAAISGRVGEMPPSRCLNEPISPCLSSERWRPPVGVVANRHVVGFVLNVVHFVAQSHTPGVDGSTSPFSVSTFQITVIIYITFGPDTFIVFGCMKWSFRR